VKFNTKKGKTTTKASSIPRMYFTSKSARQLQRFTDGLSRRIVEGRVFFIVELASFMRDQVMALAPEIKVGDEEIAYAHDLKIAMIDGVDDADAVAIYHKGYTKKLEVEDLQNMILFIRPHASSPPWVHVLAIYGPWPGYLLPVNLGQKDARIISRTVRQDELAALERRIFEAKDQITSELLAAKSPGVSWGKNERAAGLKVHEDLAFDVLRAEFGYGEKAGKTAWRPAIRATVNRVPFVLNKYLEYMAEGKNNFDLPSDASQMITRVEAQRLASSGHFMQELAPFIPSG